MIKRKENVSGTPLRGAPLARFPGMLSPATIRHPPGWKRRSSGSTMQFL